MTGLLSRQGTTRTLAVLVLLCGSAWCLCTQRTRLALAALMLYLGLLDGYLKLATGSTVITLIRDALLYAIVAGVLVRTQLQQAARNHATGRRLSLPPLSGWVLAYVALVLLQIPNPNGGTLVHSLAGVRPHLEFVPLFFLGYLTMRDVLSLRRFIILLLVIAAANGIVGYIQFGLNPAQLARWGTGYANLINGTGSLSGRTFTDAAGVARVRPPGLGSDAGDGGLFGVLALGGAFALSSLTFRIRYRLMALLLGAGALAAIITSQGRGVLVSAVATALAYGVMTATSQRRLANLSGLAVTALVAYFVITSIVGGAGGNAFRYQGLSAAKILATTTSSGGRPGQLHAIGVAAYSYPLGAGLGTAGPAASTGGASSIAGTVNAESEFSFLILEAGIPGMVVLVGFAILLLLLGVSRCRREPDPRTRALLAAIISPIAGIIVIFYASADTVTVPDGPFLWFAGGVIAYWLVGVPRERRASEGGEWRGRGAVSAGVAEHAAA